MKDDIFFLCLLYYITWHNFGRGILLIAILYSNSKRIISIIMGSSSTDFCHGLLKNLEVLPLQYQYIFYLLLRIENLYLLLMYRRTLIKEIILTYIYP